MIFRLFDIKNVFSKVTNPKNKWRPNSVSPHPGGGDHMVPYGTIRYNMVPYGTIWYPKVPYGTIRYLMVP